MFRYGVFGGALHSDLEFPGLRVLPEADATWTFRTVRAARDEPVAELLGEDPISAELTVRLHRLLDGGLLLEYSAFGLGSFRISADGADIAWTPGTDPPLEQVRWVLLGRVLALAMYQAGTVCLHGSCVAFAGGGICFLAPKFCGKSTLATALLAAGARLMTDDVLPVDPGPPVQARPGVQSLRLWQDGTVAWESPGSRSTVEASGKIRIDRLPAARLAAGPEPLTAVYVLEPAAEEPEPGVAVSRVRLAAMSAFEMLVRHTFVAPLLGTQESPALVRTASAIVSATPVFSLRVVRDIRRLPEVVEALVGWHAGEVAR